MPPSKKPSTGRSRLSKSRYLAGLQCRKMLWWQVHEPDESEDGGSGSPQIDRGIQVGLAARVFVGEGILVDLPPHEVAGRVAATAKAMKSKAPIIYEASFVADDVFVSVDILERRKTGYALIEVKSTTSVKDHHIPDLAVQLHVLQRAGVDVKRVELMHLNSKCRFPDLTDLFVRKDLTAEARKAARLAPSMIRTLHETLSAEEPTVDIGPHCDTPYECPFRERCWPELPRHHVSTLYRVTAKRLQAMLDDGYSTLLDLPAGYPVSGTGARQIESVRLGKMVVEPGLAKNLSALKGSLAFLDFETVGLAVPVWNGCGPYMAVPVQFSCHHVGSAGTRHHAWLANGPYDPREDLAKVLIDACAGTDTIVAYNASFEKTCIKGLIAHLPKLKRELAGIHDRIVDLLPLVRDHVYHPDFNGSFSIKAVLPALVPGMGYDDLEVGDGGTASTALESLLFGDLDAETRNALRRNLLAYCERDTLAMVKLYERLQVLS